MDMMNLIDKTQKLRQAGFTWEQCRTVLAIFNPGGEITPDRPADDDGDVTYTHDRDMDDLWVYAIHEGATYRWDYGIQTWAKRVMNPAHLLRAYAKVSFSEIPPQSHPIRRFDPKKDAQ